MVLRAVAQCFQQSVRSEDIVCRYGGEEFVIILPERAEGLAAIEEQITPKLLAEIARLPTQEVLLHLPKFRLIEILKEENIGEVVMAGQVKHAKIFSSIKADWRLIKLLASLPSKNTDGLPSLIAKMRLPNESDV